jgi:predicted ATPase
MFTSLRLERFKNFKDAELKLGPFTMLIGANASGKSNIRDAFRFLHGIARGYSLADIIGEKHGEGGEPVWSGIRGGTPAIAYFGSRSFALDVKRLQTVPFGSLPPFNSSPESRQAGFQYRIEVETDPKRTVALVRREHFQLDQLDDHLEGKSANGALAVELVGSDGSRTEVVSLPRNKPFISDVTSLVGPRTGQVGKGDPTLVQLAVASFTTLMRDMRFFDWSVDAIRQPSFPGQDSLSDNGRNLSSVLYAICQDPQSKRNMLSWIRELTPMDPVDFEFPSDPAGRVFAVLVEQNKQKITLASASDGTLRFLAFLAAFLAPRTSSFYFFEELENGIHPTRLSLLLDLIENQVKDRKIQVVATTHSPQLLGCLSNESLEHASFIYRLPDTPDAQIIRVLEMPNAERLVRKYKAADLLAEGWFESTALYMQPDPDDEKLTAKRSRSRKARVRG